MNLDSTFVPSDLHSALEARAEEADRSLAWPAESWQLLQKAGGLAWAIPQEFGGAGFGPIELMQANESLASACLTTTFILSQRDAAIRRLLTAPDHLKQQFLPRLATGECFLTVGLSQLTTSRQHGRPALLAEPTSSGGYRLHGEIPWVTGADKADAVLIGATLLDGNQILCLLPTGQSGVAIVPPMALAALSGSRTSLIRCDGVESGPDWVVAGPVERVLAGGAGGLETSCLALGLAGAAIDLLHREAENRPELGSLADRFEAARSDARCRLHALALNPQPAEALALREQCTRLALRSTQAALLISKGAGFVPPHQAQRWARQALFFLVWSCPRPVADGILSDLS